MAKATGPHGLGPEGAKLWRSITAEWELTAAEESLLLQACRTADLLESLQARLATVDLFDDSDRHPHPALTELRSQRAIYARLIGQLKLVGDQESAEGGKVRQRRAWRPLHGIA